jgi:hypothetical protein
MLTRAAMKLRRSTSVKPQRSDGLTGEIRFCKARGPMQDILSN